MRKAIWRTAAATVAVGAVVATVALLPSGANAAAGDSKASAFGLSASVLNGLVAVPPTPARSCPPGTGGTTSTVGATLLGTLGQVGVLTATNACNSLGVSSATGQAANVALTNVIPGLAAVTADLVTATCSANAANNPANTGSTSLVNAKLGTTVLNVSPTANTVLLNALGVTITLNEQTTTNGALTVNAIHIHAVVANLVTDVIIGSATCGPNIPVAPVDAFSYQNLPIVLGGLGIVVLIAFGLRTGTRRLRGLA